MIALIFILLLLGIVAFGLLGLLGLLHARFHVHRHNSFGALIIMPTYCVTAPFVTLWLISLLSRLLF